MTLDLLNTFSTLGLTLLVVGGATVLAMAIAVVVHKLFPNLADSAFEETTEILRADVFALLYTIILALVIADLSGSLSEASATVSSEASALAGLTRAADAFPAVTRDAIRGGVAEYVHAVADDTVPDNEFTALSRGESSPRAFAALEGMYASVQGFEPRSAAEQAFYKKAVDALDQVVKDRRTRVKQSQDGLSVLLRILLVVGAVVFIFLAYPASVKRLRTRVLIVGATAAFVSFAYLLTMVLDYPYAGEVSVDTTPYRTGALARYWVIDSPPRPLAAETFEPLSAQELAGAWNSDNSFGEAVFREVDGEIRGVYRSDKGTVVGTLSSDGVLRGWWCQEGSRQPPMDAGEVEWRLLSTPDGTSTVLDGRWRFAASGDFRGGWDLRKLDGLPEPPDLAAMFDDSTAFCRHP